MDRLGIAHTGQKIIFIANSTNIGLLTEPDGSSWRSIPEGSNIGRAIANSTNIGLLTEPDGSFWRSIPEGSNIGRTINERNFHAVGMKLTAECNHIIETTQLLLVPHSPFSNHHIFKSY